MAKDQKNSNEWQGININQVQWVIYQWIRFDKLYKQANGNLFSNFELVSNLQLA